MRYFIFSLILLLLFISNGFSEEKTADFTNIEQAINNGNNRLLLQLLPELKTLLSENNAQITEELKSLSDRLDVIEKRETIFKNGAKAAFDKAQNLADLNNMQEAGFYYALACTFDPQEGLYLYGYVKAVLNWADRKIKSGRPELALRALADMERFLYSNTSLIFPQNIESAANLLKEIKLKSNEASKAAFNKTYNADLDSIKEVLAESESLLLMDIPNGLDNVTAYLTKLQTVSGKLMMFYSAEQNEDVFLMMKNIASRISETSGREEAERILKKGNELLQIVSTDKSMGSFHIDEAVMINQRLSVLSFGASADLKRRIDIFRNNLEKVVLSASKISGNSVIAKLKTKYESVIKTLNKDQTKAEKALSMLYEIQNEVVAESTKIIDTETLQEMKKLVADINATIDTWRNIQNSNYEKWAIKTVIKFNEVYKNELGMLGSGRDTKNRIYLGMKDYLCSIDLKYLNVPGLRAYSEVFDFYYNELDRDQRLELSAEFVNCDKKALSEF